MAAKPAASSGAHPAPSARTEKLISLSYALAPMKNSLIFPLLVLSVAANAALIFKLNSPASSLSAPATPAKDGVVAPSLDTEAASHVTTASTPGGKDAIAPSAIKNKINGVDWAELSAGGDLRTLVARMRAAGFPGIVVHGAVWAELEKQFGPRRQALIGPDTYAYWKNISPYGDPKSFAAWRSLQHEQDKMMEDLLGPDAVRKNTFLNAPVFNPYGNLSDSKAAQVKQIEQDYQDLEAQTRAEAQGIMLNEDRLKLAYIEEQKRQDLAKVLTPEEMQDYLLRRSPTAMQMRYQLAAFQPTEDEFRALYPLQAAFDAKYSYAYGTAPHTGDWMIQRQADEQQLIAQAKTVLGPDRGAEYERSRDYTYQTVANIANRMDLPKDAAVQVWTLQKDIQQRAQATRSDQSLTPAQRYEQLTALQTEAAQKISTTLGPKGYQAYQATVGTWIRYLAPPPRAANPKG